MSISLKPDVPAHLPYAEQGTDQTGTPLVLLHGFGGDRQGWLNIQTGLSTRLRSIAFDLPGHGTAVGWPRIGNAGISAKAVSQSLDALELEKVHLAGHSMGGAVAALIALRMPERIASLTLVGPGGFGPQINADLLRRYASAAEEDELAALLPEFFAPSFRMPRQLARHASEARSRPGAVEALQEIVEEILDGDGQKTLPLGDVAALPLPVQVIWGLEDGVLPVSQSTGLPDSIAVHRLAGTGHMPHLEQPRDVIRLIAEITGGR
ncbi:MAG: alpha/beta hydrolase [Polymorphum sp.]|nr:alpha/beta hydrolase [Polymorphum sp.]